MKIIILCLIWVTLVTLNAYGEYKYNPTSKKYELTNSSSELKYNPMTKKHTYEARGSKLKFNPFSKKYEYAPPEYDER